jgi:hypothetical protein
MKVSMLRWLIYWGKLVDAIVGILTLGIVNAGVSLKLARAYSRHRHKQRLINKFIKGMEDFDSDNPLQR